MYVHAYTCVGFLFQTGLKCLNVLRIIHLPSTHNLTSTLNAPSSTSQNTLQSNNEQWLDLVKRNEVTRSEHRVPQLALNSLADTWQQ